MTRLALLVLGALALGAVMAGVATAHKQRYATEVAITKLVFQPPKPGGPPRDRFRGRIATGRPCLARRRVDIWGPRIAGHYEGRYGSRYATGRTNRKGRFTARMKIFGGEPGTKFRAVVRGVVRVTTRGHKHVCKRGVSMPYRV